MINTFVCNTAPFQPTIQDGKALTATSIEVNWLKPTEKTGPTTYEVTVHDVILRSNKSENCSQGIL
jgi:hypothetical protein